MLNTNHVHKLDINNYVSRPQNTHNVREKDSFRVNK